MEIDRSVRARNKSGLPVQECGIIRETRTKSGSVRTSGGPIANRPQVTNLPHILLELHGDGVGLAVGEETRIQLAAGEWGGERGAATGVDAEVTEGHLAGGQTGR